MRVLNEMFHIEGEQLIKTTNGQPVPEDEPVFILRARDRLAVPVLQIYRILLVLDQATDYIVEGVSTVIGRFLSFKANHPDRMKQPGITRGK